MNKKNITSIISGLAIAILLFGSGFKLGELSSSSSSVSGKYLDLVNINTDNAKKAKFDFELYWQVMEMMNKKYVDKKLLDPQKMFYGALKGMVASVGDPYTYFLTPDDNKAMKSELGGRFEGIGASLGLKNGRIIVIAPIKGSPAEKAGIRAGDYIQKVDGKVAKDWTLQFTVSKIRGTKGTKVSITVVRPPSPQELTFSIIRDEIKVEAVEL
ncbi:MAG: PDZ domain-containing protein, partial [Microgenomates group bacterium]